MIRISGLNKYYNKNKQNELHVINDISVDLPERGMVAIFGKSGCGKTTLLNIIGGLDGFATGSVSIEGKDIRESTDDVRNAYIGYIFQNYNLHKTRSCFDNVADALRLCGMSDGEEIKRRVAAALRNVGMEKFSERTPDTLSGGQQQRIAIARAIVKNPRVILADEPTGNLDEANTVMIMDLLREIARDHLVLIVTHEANLVDHYCDTVIELSDGSIVSKRDNLSANGYSAKDKNCIYLGELEKTSLEDGRTRVEYYGDAPAEPIRLRIVNSGGKLYLKVDSDKVRILDEGGEMTLREGVYEEKTPDKSISHIDMSELPTVECTKSGRLFNFLSSAKSGYFANFGKKKRGKNALLACLFLFSAAVVIMTAVFGTSVGAFLDAKSSYNHNVFYVLTDKAEISAELNRAYAAGEGGIDYLRLTDYYLSATGDERIYFRPGSFETFREYGYYSSGLESNAVYLSSELVRDKELITGRREGLAEDEVLISSFVADKLLESSTYGYISEYDDLIGLMSSDFSLRSRSVRIAGIVDSDEPAVYLSPRASARLAHTARWGLHIGLDSDYGIDVKKGESTLLVREDVADTKYPSPGESFLVSGGELMLTECRKFYDDYLEWLRAQGEYTESGEEAYFRSLLVESDPSLEADEAALSSAVDAMIEEKHYEYLAGLYSRLDEYIREWYQFNPDTYEVWLYVVKGVKNAERMHYTDDFYKAVAYRDLYGRYPTVSELAAASDELPSLVDFYDDHIRDYDHLYIDEFYMNNQGTYSYYVYLVDESDYVRITSELGNSHPTVEAPSDPNALLSYYTVIHSSDPEATAAWLAARYPDEVNELYYRTLVTPDSILEELTRENRGSIVGSLVAMISIAAVMSVCMYFIMRSSLMNRIKEVGIYRAIGVSKKNLVFRFFVEAAVISSLTVLVGYLVTSGFISACFAVSPMASSLFFYPAWLALIVLVFLAVLCLVCGTLPILTLLRKTPSEILAKYDI